MNDFEQDARWFAIAFAQRYEVTKENNGSITITLGREATDLWEPERPTLFEHLLVSTYSAAILAARDSDTTKTTALQAFQNGLWFADDLLQPYTIDTHCPQQFHIRVSSRKRTRRERRSRLHELLADVYADIFCRFHSDNTRAA